MKKPPKLKIIYYRKYITLLVAILLSTGNFHCQLSPALDASWILDVNASDEFNTTTLNTSKWKKMGNLPYQGVPFNMSNVVTDGSDLRLKFTANGTFDGGPVPPNLNDPAAWWLNNSNPSQFKTGGIISKFLKSYGYYEISAKLPGWYDNSQSKLTEVGLAPQFWLGGENYCWQPPNPNGAPCHQEIDIWEGNGWDNRDFALNAHWWYDAYCNDVNTCIYSRSDDFMFTPEADLVNNYHKYGFEFLPDRMIWYFDDVPYYIVNNATGLFSQPTAVWIDFAINTPGKLANGSQPYPTGLIDPNMPVTTSLGSSNKIEFVVDYFRFYNRDISKCLLDYLVLNGTDIANFPNQVWRNINIGQTGLEFVTMNPNSQQTFRSSGDFNVICDFEIPLSADLTVLRLPCI